MTLIVVLAAELTERTLWNPTILGLFVALCAAVLFFGSVYLLMGTNMGARLGFLVAFAGMMGFMVILSFLWVTTSFPLNVMRGALPTWEVIDVYDGLDQAPEDVRDIDTEGEDADATEAADVKAEIDENLVTQTPEGDEELAADANEFAIFADVTDFQVTDTWLLGGSDPNPLRLEFTHVPLFAAAEFCENREVDVLPGLPPPEPECDPDGESGVIVLERDLGTLRLPPVVALVGSSILFALGLLGLHWYERDQRALRRESDAASTSPGGSTGS